MSLIGLLSTRRFLPLFLAQFLGALNDNLFKNAILIVILYRLAEPAGLDGGLLMPLGAGLFVLPFFLLSATAGQMADRHDKARMARWVKGMEVLIALAGSLALVMESILGMFGVLFLLGAQSAVFGPIKYAMLPEALRRDELVAGNALFEAGTFLAILVGTIVGGLLVMVDGGAWLVSGLLVGLALVGFLAALAVPSTGVSAPATVVGWNVLRETARGIGAVRDDKGLFQAILGISWFWLVGAVFLAEFPAFSKEVIGGDERLVTLFMTLFSVGIGLGSLLCQRLLKGEVSVKYVPFAAIGLALAAGDLWLASSALTPAAEPLGPLAFAGTLAGIRVMVDLVLLAICGGLYIVPLYAFLQVRAENHHRARVIATNNVMNAAFMVVGSAALAGLLALGLTVPQVFLVVALASLVAAVVVCALLPRHLFQALSAWVLRRLFRVEVKGLEHLKALEGPAVIVANHASWLDGPLLNAFLPLDSAFAIDKGVFATWWGGLTRLFADMIPVDTTSPMGAKTMIRAVREGKRLVIFPEGRLTTTGALMKIHEGPAVIADKAGAHLVPLRIEGTRFSKLSRLKGKMPLRLFPKITLTVLPPRTLDLPEGLTGRARRRVAAGRLYDVMSEMMFRTTLDDATLFGRLLEVRRSHGGKTPIVMDVETLRKPVTLDRLVLGSFVLGHRLARETERGERVGLMLPNTAGSAVTFFALQAVGRVPAMLNFSTGADTMISAVDTAGLRLVLTSRRFVEAAKLGPAIDRLSEHVRVAYLEDLRADIGAMGKLRGLLARAFPSVFAVDRSADDPAVVLFTSGSEGKPKGVVLSHRNLLANMAQLSARVDFNGADRVFNALPMFHSFGLTGGTLLPILSGIETVLYPSPLHYRIVPELCYATNATILFGTDTFLTGYARRANPYDFHSLRMIFAGAEKVRDETRRLYLETFGLRILEGYGATETAPVLAVNTPMHHRAGTVGRLLPGIETRLEVVPGVEDGARLHVRGPNVMLGYLLPGGGQTLQPPEEGWYDTGDLVAVDDDGFVRIVGRAKRFVKVAGEMVSLNAVEAAATALWPEERHAAIGLPDPRKGERIILVTERKDATRPTFLAHAQDQGLAELMVPRDVVVVETLPLLATGKVDYPAVHAMVTAT
jgi:acyl-[acyl-carrier-protein]-phospholipid O-acyltransferase/long-chain-fatty-acid--[acyl-carrier-protein] ligase